MTNSISNKIPYVPQNTLDPAAGLNDAIDVIDALLNTRVESVGLNAPPTGVGDGEMYIIGSAATGEWAGHNHAFARYVANGDFWQFYEAGVTAWLALNKADNNLYKWDVTSAAWILAAGIPEAPEDSKFYGRKNGTWAEVPGLTNPILEINHKTPDTSGNVEVLAGDIPFAPSTNSDIQSVTVEAAIQELDSEKAPLGRLSGINNQNGTAYTLKLSDIGKDVRCNNAAPVSLTIPANADVAFPIGAVLLFSQAGAGAVTAVAGGTHVIVEGANGLTTTAQHDVRALEQVAIDEWRVI